MAGVSRRLPAGLLPQNWVLKQGSECQQLLCQPTQEPGETRRREGKLREGSGCQGVVVLQRPSSWAGAALEGLGPAPSLACGQSLLPGQGKPRPGECQVSATFVRANLPAGIRH